MSTFRPVSSLLFTTAFLLAGHGLHMTFLPLRASELGLSQTLIGLSGSAYFAGFLTGALMIPPIIARVGHIRSFTALLAIFLSSFLFLSLVDRRHLLGLGPLCAGRRDVRLLHRDRKLAR
jgi:MFS family permease